MNNCFTEAIAFDSTTLALYFQQGLTRRISTALVDSQSIATIQNLALVMAAVEKIESKFDLSVKQAMQVEVPASGNPTPTSEAAITTWAVAIPMPSTTSPPTIVVVVKGPSMLAGAMLPVAGVPMQGVVAGVGVPPLANHLTLLLTRIYIAQLAMPLGTPNGSAPLSIVR